MLEGEPSAESISAELKRIYDEDQADRQKIDFSQPEAVWRPLWEVMMDHDEDRIKRVREIIFGKQLKSGSDFLRAAMIFQHGPQVGDYALAHLLALKASEMRYVAEENEADPLWLAAAAKDRWLKTIGQPQDFGTQYERDSKTGENRRYSVNPVITDEERRKWHVPPLTETK